MPSLAFVSVYDVVLVVHILAVVVAFGQALSHPLLRLARLTQDDPRAEYDALLRQVGLVGVASALLVLVAVFPMVTKPGA